VIGLGGGMPSWGASLSDQEISLIDEACAQVLRCEDFIAKTNRTSKTID
jgi:hypothetical protein